MGIENGRYTAVANNSSGLDGKSSPPSTWCVNSPTTTAMKASFEHHGLSSPPSSPPPEVAANSHRGGRSLGIFASDLPAIVRSALPFLAFLVAYGLNARIPILPRASDAHCVRLRNVSAFEETLFGQGRAPHLIVASLFTSPFLDFASALPYLVHYLIPIGFPLYVAMFGSVAPVKFSNASHASASSVSAPKSPLANGGSVWSNNQRLSCRAERIIRFYRLLGWSMWAHYVIWFLFPTAPPWVADNVARYRALLTVDPSTSPPPPLEFQPREGCAFARIDRLTGVDFFHAIFAGNPIPFASFPSGHVAWPTCVLATHIGSGCGRRRRALLIVYVAWVAWATMYSCHHYLSDIMAAVVVVFAVERLLIACVRCQNRRPRIGCFVRCCGCSAGEGGGIPADGMSCLPYLV